METQTGYRRARVGPRRKLLPQELTTFERDLEMARLRVVEGLTLEEIGPTPEDAIDVAALAG